MEQKEIIKADLKQAVKIGCAIEKMTMGELAKRTGREGSTLSGLLSRGRPNLKTATEIINGVNAKVVVRYANGQEVELEV